MYNARGLIAAILMVGVHLSLAAGDISVTWEDFEKSSDEWAKKEFSLSGEERTPKMFRLLTSAAPASNETSPPSSSWEGWMTQCDHLSGDLEKSWNLTVVVAEKNWPVVENVAETLYDMLLNCTEGHVWNEAECLIKKLVVLKNILIPAVKMNLVFVQDAWHLIPPFVNDFKECFTIGS